MKRNIFLGICLVTLSLFSMNFVFVAAKKDKYSCDLLHGEYLDGDGDGLLDDLLIIAALYHDGPDKPNTLNFYMYLSVEYPSGYMIDFTWRVTVYVKKDYTFEYHISDGVLEPGWYTANLYLLLDGMSEISDTDELIFDPPHVNSKGSDPLCAVMIY